MKIFYLAVLGIVVLFWSCIVHPPAPLEQPVIRKNGADGSQPTSPGHVNSSPATEAEVNAALHRIFADAVRGVPHEQWFTTGDFNGDGSTDLAAFVLPNGSKLRPLNDPLANWTIQDATHVFFPPADQRIVMMPPKPRAQFVHSDVLLMAIIHGYGQSGWRDPNARQAYLVRHAGDVPIEARPAPDRVEGAAASIIRSEIIFEPVGKPGFLFWTGSQYAWRAQLSDGVKTADAKSRD